MGCSYSMFICSLGAAQWGCANSSIPSSFLQGNASTESPLTHPPAALFLDVLVALLHVPIWPLT